MIKTAAASLAVSLTELKAHLKISGTTDDTLLTDLLEAAEAQIEDYTNRKIISQVWYYYLSGFPNEIVLPYSPVSSVASIKYYDSSNVQQTLADSLYMLDVNMTPCIISTVDTWPEVYEDRSLPVTIEYTAGYANAAAVPERLKRAIMYLAADMYEYREDHPRTEFTTWKALAYPYKIWW
jgi:uncharacterized phiE125 gp8 family phage protein